MQRRTLLKATALASGLTRLAAPAIAQPANLATLRFVPQANLTLLDPVFTTATVTSNHGYYVFDTLYSVGPDGIPHQQMAEGHTVSDDKLTWRIRLREGLWFHDGSPVRAADCIINYTHKAIEIEDIDARVAALEARVKTRAIELINQLAFDYFLADWAK